MSTNRELERKPQSNRKPLLAMQFCAKNEARLLEAHLKYHRHLGVSKAYAYLDACTDESLDILRSFPWVECFTVDPAERQRFRYVSDMLVACMNDALERARRDGYDWLLVIDLDELAFGENPESESSKTSLRRRGSLVDMLTQIPEAIEVVSLRTREVVPMYLGEDFEFWKQRYFQDQHVLTRMLLDLRTGETSTWSDFLGHRLGKPIVRTSASVQAYTPHSWVRDQNKRFPLRPANMPVPIATRGYHYHFFAFQNSHFQKKFLKSPNQSDVRSNGIPERYSKQCFRLASKRLTGDALHEYLDRYFYVPEPELKKRASERYLIYDDTVERILAEVGYFSRFQKLLRRSRQLLGKIFRQGRATTASLCQPADSAPLVVSDGQAVFYDPSMWPDGSCSGFHHPEIQDGRYFRWSSTNAELVVPVKAGDYQFSVDLGSILNPSWKKYVSFSFNGRRIPGQALRLDGSCLTFEVKRRDCSPTEQRLTVSCTPLDTSNWAYPDLRKLGIPVFGISVAMGTVPEMLRPSDQPASRETDLSGCGLRTTSACVP